MDSLCKRIGDVGEASIIAKLLTYKNVCVSKPVGENVRYDLVVDIGGKLYRAQVKSTEQIKKDRMVFYLCSFNPRKKQKRMYTKDDVDIFLFYCMENNFFGMAFVEDLPQKSLTLTTKEKNEQTNKRQYHLKFASDFLLEEKIKEL